MIKTDRAIYRTRRPEDYDWLMDKLEEADCEWQGGGSPISGKCICDSAKSDSYIRVDKKAISFSDEDYWNYDEGSPGNKDDVLIEVSDLMENEKKAEILDKLKVMNRHLENELKKIEEEDDETQKIKKVVYTTEVYFE